MLRLEALVLGLKDPSQNKDPHGGCFCQGAVLQLSILFSTAKLIDSVVLYHIKSNPTPPVRNQRESIPFLPIRPCAEIAG